MKLTQYIFANIFLDRKKIATFAHPFWGKLCLIVNEKV